MSIFTFGHGGQRVPDIQWFCETHGALLVDIRHSPYSVRPEWGGKHLATLLGYLPTPRGNHYWHLPELGNKNYNIPGAPIKIVDLAEGVSKVLEAHVIADNIVLMCGCGRVTECHRNIVANDIEESTGDRPIELRFTWSKSRPVNCGVCGAKRGDADIKRDELVMLPCGHAIVWRER